jgi:glutathione synthase/RimK-type ligase-like ATP-grasp enzyme
MGNRFIWIGVGPMTPRDNGYRIWFGIPWYAKRRSRLLSIPRGANLCKQLYAQKSHLLGDIDDFRVRDRVLFYRARPVHLQKYSHVVFCYRPFVKSEKQLHRLQAIENLASEQALPVVNPISSAKYFRYKDEFFRILGQHGLPHPVFQEITSRDTITLNFPFILKANNATGGHSTVLVEGSRDLDAHFDALLHSPSPHPGRKLLAIEYLDTYQTTLRCFLAGRLFVFDDVIAYQYANISQQDWNIHVHSVTRFHDSSTLVEANHLVKRLIEQERSTMLKLRNALSLNFFNVDFTVVNGKLVFLEAGWKWGPTPRGHYNCHVKHHRLGDKFIRQMIPAGAAERVRDFFNLASS